MNEPFEIPPADEVPDGSQIISIEIFYKTASDTSVFLSDGKTLKFNKAMFCASAKSRILYQIFFGSLKDDMPKFDDIDSEIFKLFLDCVMGFEPFNFNNCFKIFPVIHKYQIQHLIEKCIECLMPQIMDEKVADLFNMAELYSGDCKQFMQRLISFIPINEIYEFLEIDEYCFLLELNTLKTILSYLHVDSGLLVVLANWGKYYVQKHSLNFETLKEFFEKNDLLKYFKLEYFETTAIICEFHLSEEGKDIFTFEEILFHMHNSKELVFGKRKWMNVKKDSTIIEEIFVPARESGNIRDIALKIERNKAVFRKAQATEADEQGNKKAISCKIEIFTVFLNGSPLKTRDDTMVLEFLEQEPEKPFVWYFNSRETSRDRRCLVRITWNFLQNCRILLTSKEGDPLNISETMYFTKNILPRF